MSEITLAVVLDILAKAGTLGVAGLTIWALLTERLVPKARLEDLRTTYKERLEYRQHVIDKQEMEIAGLHAELAKARRNTGMLK